IEMNPSDDTGYSMAVSVGTGVVSIANSLKKIKPDIVLVLGDRIEALSAAIAAAYMNIPVAHIHGGDVTRAGLDESARHAITKFSHIHLAATEKSAERILKMGEDPWRVHVVGAPALDPIVNYSADLDEIAKRYGLDTSKPIVLLLQHSVTTAADDAAAQIRETLDAITEMKLQTIAVYPNSDAGGRKIISVLKEYEKYPFIKVFKSIPHDDYIGLMRIASVKVGNTSSGIIEAPSLNLPSVNIGTRQEGRERGYNVIDVDHDREHIKSAIKKALYDEAFKKKVSECSSPYGNGTAGIKIADILSKIKIDKALLQKKLTY
ncbi:MAG: UDP-N-acetylglucosamine 2-epimerase (hydrolyzing), partial [Candidatus Aenigmarchaeota archaeon]|nr:UDP-N-acetylglucosamine 2-epimerase (hydrolyzing) [Candidatus Aenigmarchaeota archaeon]